MVTFKHTHPIKANCSPVTDRASQRNALRWRTKYLQHWHKIRVYRVALHCSIELPVVAESCEKWECQYSLKLSFWKRFPLLASKGHRYSAVESGSASDW